MIKRLLRKLSPVGLDISEQTVRAVQLERRDGRWWLHAAAAVPRAKPGAAMTVQEAERLAAVLERRGFRTGSVVVGAPAGSGEASVLELPGRSSGAPVEQIARGEMARSLKCEGHDLEIGLWELPTAPQPQGKPAPSAAPVATMVVACRTAAADALAAVLGQAGLEVAAIDAPCLALARVCESWLAPAAVGAILELAPESARAVVTYGRAVVYERTLPEGSVSALRSVLAEQLDLEPEVASYLLAHHGLDGAPPEEAAVAARFERARRVIADRLGLLAAEVQRSVAYAGGRYPGSGAGRLLIVGDGAQTPGLDRVLAESTGMEARVVRPCDAGDVPDAYNEFGRDATLSLAFGLATWRGEDVA